MTIVGQRMRKLREASHLSQTEIAKLCGSNQSTIGKTESGKTAPSIKLLVWWADYFDVSLDYICGRTDQPEGKLYECKPRIKPHSEGDIRQFIEMCFDPDSPFSGRLKEALLNMMEGDK